MTKKTLLTISAIADAMDVLTMGIPGPWSLITEIPAITCHFIYAGPKAIIVLADSVPGLGILPIYTIAALSYDKEKEAVVPPAPPLAKQGGVIIEADVVRPPPLPATIKRST